ncbi:S8 family peptidase [Haloglycomyces albus]|uniref:S8 family peptidase n=1 Tax=Haloglycomyces albus TaxID=526067 RepID=UPI00046C8DEA|nr:S8 family serine peptidase [Haloglycomyces albus]
MQQTQQDVDVGISKSLWSQIQRFVVGLMASALAVITTITFSPATAMAENHELANQWILDQINAEQAWEHSKGEGITVAVLDSGIMPHPYFDDKDIRDGKDLFTDEEQASNAAAFHGTQVATAALHVAPEITVLPVAVHSESDIGPNFGAWPLVAEGIRWAVDEGADIINFSFGIPGQNGKNEDLMRKALQYAMDNNVIVVGGSGNDPDGPVLFPAAYEGVVTVTGSNPNNELWVSASTGPETTVAAPADEQRCPVGQHVDSGVEGESEDDWYNEGNVAEDKWEDCRGTSLASPAVAGALALILASNSDVDANNAINRLIHTSSNGYNGHDNELGYGIIDANDAIEADNLDTVDQNPLGYPLGGPGTSYSSDDESDTNTGDGGASDNSADENASNNEESNTLAFLLIAAASLILIAASITWLMLRNRAERS